MRIRVIRFFFPVAAQLLLAILLIAVGCSGPSAAINEPVPPPIVETDPFVSGMYIMVDENESKWFNLATMEGQPFAEGGRLVFESVSRSREYAVIGTATDIESRLVLLSKSTGAATLLHTGSPSLIYSAAWSPSGEELAFGFYEPRTVGDRPAQGAGDILIANTVGEPVTRLGCTASKEVILWSIPDQLVVRDSNNMYRVSRANCSTIQDVDIRRWHSIHPAPVGSRIAYIYRELAFNRETRTYDPDSALFIAGTAGAGGIKVVGDRYRPRNTAWSPDGNELAFDVLVNPDGDKRAVAVYNVESTETVYVAAPGETEPSQSHPSWDATGAHISYLVDDSRLVVRSPGSAFGQGIELPENEAVVHLGWLSSQALLVRDSTGTIWMYDLISGSAERLGAGSALVF